MTATRTYQLLADPAAVLRLMLRHLRHLRIFLVPDCHSAILGYGNMEFQIMALRFSQAQTSATSARALLVGSRSWIASASACAYG